MFTFENYMNVLFNLNKFMNLSDFQFEFLHEFICACLCEFLHEYIYAIVYDSNLKAATSSTNDRCKKDKLFIFQQSNVFIMNCTW